MATKRGFSGWRAISKVEEAAYDTAATIAATYRNAADPIQLVAELADGTELVGTAAEEANEQEIMAYHSEGQEDLPRLRPNEAALLLAYCCGNLNQSPAAEPAADYYTHSITFRPTTFANGAQDGSVVPLTSLTVEDTSSWPSSGSFTNPASGNTWTYSGKNATTFTGVNNCTDTVADNQMVYRKQPDYDYLLPSFTILDYVGASYKRQWPGQMVRQVEISGQRKGFVQATAQYLGSGTYTEPATARPAEITEVYLKMGDCSFTIGGTWDGRTFSGGTSLNTKVRSFSWTCANEIPDDLLYEAGGGQQIQRAERLRRRQTLQLVVEFSDHTELTYVTAQTSLNLLVNMVGASGSYGVQLIFPQFRFNVAPVSGGVGVLLRTMDAAVQRHSSYDSFMAKVFNKQVDYLHA